jgi:hypothetical protein
MDYTYPDISEPENARSSSRPCTIELTERPQVCQKFGRGWPGCGWRRAFFKACDRRGPAALVDQIL